MPLTFETKGDRVIANWEGSSVTFMHCIRKGIPGIFSTAYTGPRLPYSIYTEAVSEARKLLKNKETKPVQKRPPCVPWTEMRKGRHLADAHAHEEELLRDVPEHDR